MIHSYFKALQLIRILLPIVLLGCSTAPQKKNAERVNEDRLKVIDAHTHTMFFGKVEPSSGIMMNSDEYFKELKEINAVAAIAHAPPKNFSGVPGYKEEVDLRSQNIFHCLGIGPRVNSEELEKAIRSGRYRCFKV